MEVDRTFAFVDLCGFTAFTEQQGSGPATQMLASFRAATRDIASRRGVRIAKWLGDGAMFVGVEAQPVLESFLEIEQRSVEGPGALALRYGVTFGKAILFEGDDYIGSAVNLAARLCDVAAPHEMLVGCELGDYIPPWAEAEPVTPVIVRGFAQPVPTLRVHRRESSTDTVNDPICRMDIPRDAVGLWRDEVGFCSASCADLWDQAPPPVASA